ncbi:MAG: hypothetical protein IBX43_05020 [Campylobacterales bacterium]|nr:hypothetical protein [Campylobacterales bacterium]
MAESFIESVNKISKNLDAVVATSDLFSPEVVDKLAALSNVNLTLIIEDFQKGNYLGNRKIDIDLALNNLSLVELPAYSQADIVLVSGVKLEMPFDNGAGGVLELTSHADIKNYITSHLLYAQVVDTEIVVAEAFGDLPTMIRVRDADGKASNIERIELHVYSGTVVDTKPVYFWAKTTSSLETLANRIGDIIQLGNDIDSIVTLSQRIDELIALQVEIAKIIAVHTDLASVVTTAGSIASVNTLAASILDVNTIALKIVELNAIYADISGILAASAQAQIATDQALISTQKATASGVSATASATSAQLALEKSNEIKSITGQAQTLIPGSLVTVSYNPVDGKFTFGIPQGAKGDKGDAFAVNAVGLAAQKSLYDLQVSGFSFLAIDEALIYFKLSATSADWSIGSPFGKGDTGDTGATGNGIASISFVSTTDISGFAAQSGGTDTYRITFTDTTTSDFNVYNGQDSDVYMADLTAHTSDIANPHSVTKTQVGLGNVDNTSDVNKPVSTLQGQAIALKADDTSVLHKTGDEIKAGVLTLTSSPIIPDPTAAQQAASKNYVDIRTGLDPLIYSLGQPGEIGFGIATAPKAMYEQIGAIPLSGHDVLGHDNYGNYMHGYSGAILCFIPKHYFKITGNTFEFSDIAETGFVLDRSFINGGIEIPGVFVAKYSITRNGTIASAQPFKDPMSTNSGHNPISALAGTPANNYGGLYTAVKTMSAEAFLTPVFHYSMLARIAKAHGEAAISTTACAFIDVLPKLPKGCNNNALSDAQDSSVLYTASGYLNCGLTGSASNFAKTTHNGQACGIADLNGNMWEVASGFIRYTANGFLVLKESVDIRTIKNDSITAGAGGAYDINLYDVIDISDVVFDATTTYFGNGTNQVFAMSTDRASVAYKRTAFGIPTATGVSATGTTEFGNDGLYRNLVDQVACLRGGHWTPSSGAGVSAMTLNNTRTSSNDSVGGRASFLCV